MPERKPRPLADPKMEGKVLKALKKDGLTFEALLRQMCPEEYAKVNAERGRLYRTLKRMLAKGTIVQEEQASRIIFRAL